MPRPWQLPRLRSADDLGGALIWFRRTVRLGVSRSPPPRPAGTDERPGARVNSRVGANLLARRWLDRFRSNQRQRRQHRPGHRCDRARSSPRDPASRHLFWISVGSPRNGGASEHHVRYSGGDLSRPPTGRTSTIWPIGVIDIERDTERGSRRASIDCACELGNFDALVFAGRAAGSNGGAVAVPPTSTD